MDFKNIEPLNKMIEEKNKQIDELTIALKNEQAKAENIQEFYEAILALMPGHVYWLNKDNVFLGCNDLQAKNAKLKSRKDIVGKTNYDMPWKDQADELNKLNNKVMETGVPHTAEEYAVMADGMTIYLSNKTPLRNKNNDIIGVLGLSVDITEQKKMEVALHRAKEDAVVANHTKTEFLTNMSHDILTPVRGIADMAMLLLEHAQQPLEKQYADWIYQSSKQLLQLLNGVFDIVTLDNMNDSDVCAQPLDLRKMIQAIVHLILPTLKIKNIELQIEIDNLIPQFVITDNTKLHKALLNLLGNSIKYADSGPIIIKIEKLSDDTVYTQLHFCIINANSTSNDNQKIDFSIAQKYVGLLGGEIRCEQSNEIGTIFEFTLSIKMAQNDL